MRDTDADWRLIAETEPHFGVLSENRYRAANVDAAALDTFYAEGQAEVDFVAGELKRRWLDFAPGSATDFGCGVGRLSLGMLRYAPEVTGVDIAPSMRRLAYARAGLVGAQGITFTDEIPAATDWVNSCIVFQHIPPDRGLGLLDRLLRSLSPGGFVSLQFALHRRVERLIGLDARFVRFDGTAVDLLAPEDDPPAGMRMYDYDAGAIIARLFDAGVLDISLCPTDHGGHIGAWFFGRKNIN